MDEQKPFRSKTALKPPLNRKLLAAMIAVAGGFAQPAFAIDGCPGDMEPVGSNLIINGDFSTAPPGGALDAGEDFGGFTAGIPYVGPNLAPDDTGISIITTGTYTGFVQDQGPFPGDDDNNAAAADTWLYSNGNNLPGDAPFIYWEQTVGGLEDGATYVFSAYVNNVISGDPEHSEHIGEEGLLADPIVTALVDEDEIAPAMRIYDHVDSLSGDNGEDIWKRIEGSFTASGTTALLQLQDSNDDGIFGDDLATTAISMYACETPGPAPTAEIEVTPTSIAFADTVVGGVVTEVITVSNSGELDLALGPVLLDGLTVYSVTDDQCSDQTLAQSASCEITVQFAPTLVGEFIDTLQISSNDADEALVDVTLSGNGVAAPVGAIALEPEGIAADGLNFGELIANQDSKVLNVTLTNDGEGDLNDIAVSSDNAVFTPDASACGSSLPAGESCPIAVTFLPDAVGPFTGQLSIISSDATAAVPLTGTGAINTTDSDDDGLSDELEGKLGTDPMNPDTDNDGLKDGMEDINANGVTDDNETDPLKLDTDGDTISDGDEDVNKNGVWDEGDEIDPRNPDTDGDGIQDGVENKDGDLDLGEEGETDPRILDTDGDGLSDGLEDTNKNGVYDVGPETNPLVVDTDGDGLDDGVEDANRNGIVDQGETNPRVKEAVEGDTGEQQPETGTETDSGTADAGEVLTDLEGGIGGGGAAGLPLLGMTGVMLWMRRRKLTIAISAVLGGGALVAGNAQAEQGEMYLGIAAGQSMIEPDPNNTTWVVDEDSDAGFKLYLGYDITDMFSVEGYMANLGSAGMMDGTNSGEVDYNAYGLEGLVYLPGNLPGWSAFGKLGISNVDTESSNVPIRDVENSQVSAGLGVEYQFDSGVSLRGEYQYFDEDASLLTIGALKRFGNTPPPPPPVVIQPDPVTPPPPPPAPEPAPVVDSDGDGVLDPQDKCPGTASGIQVDGSGCAIDVDGDGVLNPNDRCPDTQSGVIVDTTGCPVVEKFSGVLEGVNFFTASDQLTGEAKTILNGVAEELNAYPGIRVIVVGHTDNDGSESYNKDLSQRRARQVANYLVTRGVEGSRLRYTGRGELEPIASNTTEEGRARNRRVEFIAQEN